MFNKKDYLAYFNQLYQVEIGMKKEVMGLLKFIDNPADQNILKKIAADEVRHAKIVETMKGLI